MGCIRVFMTPSCKLGGDQVQPLRSRIESWVLSLGIELEDLVARKNQLADEIHEFVEQADSNADVRIYRGGMAFCVFISAPVLFPPFGSVPAIFAFSFLRGSFSLFGLWRWGIGLRRGYNCYRFCFWSRAWSRRRNRSARDGRRGWGGSGRCLRSGWQFAVARKRSVRSSKRSGPSFPVASIEASTCRVASTVSRIRDTRAGVSSRLPSRSMAEETFRLMRDPFKD